MSETFILFEVAGAVYAVRSGEVLLVEMPGLVTPVPGAPGFVEGVIAVRGSVIPVVGMRKRFGQPERPNPTPAERLRERVIVIRLGERLIGLKVDTAREFLRAEPEQIQPPPDGLEGPGVAYLEGVIAQAQRLVLIVNLARLFNPDERDELAQPTAPPSTPARARSKRSRTGADQTDDPAVTDPSR